VLIKVEVSSIIEKTKKNNDEIVLSKSELTRRFANHGDRGLTVSELYDVLIPQLVDIGEVRILPKNGNLETFAFRVETP
jgi:hypothetical protein